MALDESIFRKSALERLKNPERLDHLMQVTTPRAWIALVALTLVVLAGLLWGFLGTTPDQAQVVGIMLRQGGIFEIQAQGTGQIDELLVLPGQRVEEGMVVAYVDQPQLELSVQRLEEQLARLRTHRDSLADRLDTTTRIELDAIATQREQTQATIAASQAQVAYLEQRLRQDSIALRRELITPDILQNTISQLRAAEDAVVTAQLELRTLEGQAVSTRSSASDQVFQQDQQIADVEASLLAARSDLERAREVVSPFDGIILEDLVDVGEAVTPGRAVFTMEISGQPLDIYLFTPEGKRVQPGMEVQVVPTGLVPEEVGYMLGEVEGVSASPLGTAALNRYLRNDVLAQSFLGTTGAYLVEVDPRTDTSTVSGFRWTTEEGPDLRFGSGTLLSGNIIVEERRPITLVIPALRRWLSGEGS